ncbi:hypothetical protein [Flavobacterium sp.]
MKKLLFIAAVLFLSQSCKMADEKPESEVLKQLESKETMKSVDKDENGCLASAGYIWSKLNKECIKLFTGVQLNPIDKPQNDDETKSAYIMFNADANQAELFLPNAPQTIILSRTVDGKPWIYQDWQLISNKGFVLKQGDKTLYAGDDFIGKKVLGSDNEEN